MIPFRRQCNFSEFVFNTPPVRPNYPAEAISFFRLADVEGQPKFLKGKHEKRMALQSIFVFRTDAVKLTNGMWYRYFAFLTRIRYTARRTLHSFFVFLTSLLKTKNEFIFPFSEKTVYSTDRTSSRKILSTSSIIAAHVTDCAIKSLD